MPIRKFVHYDGSKCKQEGIGWIVISSDDPLEIGELCAFCNDHSYRQAISSGAKPGRFTMLRAVTRDMIGTPAMAWYLIGWATVMYASMIIILSTAVTVEYDWGFFVWAVLIVGGIVSVLACGDFLVWYPGRQGERATAGGKDVTPQ